MKFLVTLIFTATLVMHSDGRALSDPLDIDADRSLERAERFFESNEYDSALYYYNLATVDFKNHKNWKEYVRAVAGKAYTLVKLRRYEDAKKVLDAALIDGEKRIGKSAEMATVYYVYGILMDFSNKPEESLSMHLKALDLRKALLGPDHLLVSESYNGIGEVYRYTLRDYIEAEKHFKLSVDILERSDSVSKKLLYRGYYNLATTNRRMNDFEKGLSYAFKATQTLEAIKPSDTVSIIRCYVLIANIYNNKSLFQQAIGYYRKALGLRLARKEMSSEMANDYKNLSTAYIYMGNIPRALHCVDSALRIIAQDADYDSAEMANVHLIKGKALREANRSKEAIQSYRLSLYIQKNYSRSNVLDISNIYASLSEAMNKIEQYDSALFYIQKSIECVISQNINLVNWANPTYEMLKHAPQLYAQMAHKGTVLMQLVKGKNSVSTLELALECFDLSDKLMEIFWESQDRENSRLNFASNNYYIYELALEGIYNLYNLTSDDRYKSEAFQLMDKRKARILRQKVEQVSAYMKLKIPDNLQSQERDLKSKITALQNQMASLKRDASSEHDEIILSTEMIAKEKELEAWGEKVKSLFPQYILASKGTSHMTLDDLKNKLSREVTFVEYFFGEKAIYIFASLAGQQHIIKIDNKNISTDIYRFCGLLSNGLKSKNLDSDFKEYTHLAFSLYSDLLSPVFKAFNVDLENDNPQILIIPDGALNLLPFQALITAKPMEGHGLDYKSLKYLVKNSTISYSYDAGSLFASNHSNLFGKNLLAFGWSDGTEKDDTVNNLPWTYQELQSIAAVMPGKFVMGKEASKKSFLALAPDYSILHLAVHGEADSTDIYNNYLQFRDEKLFAHELYGFRLNANNLTVLSACETGYGKVFNAEGVYSIARAFFYAGSKSLLMTLWSIDDRSTASLIPMFYKNIEQEYMSTALRKSQLDYLQKADELSAHPSYWAGLVLWGSYKEVGTENSFNIWYVAPGCLALLMALYLFMRFGKRKRESIRVANHRL